MNTPSYLDIWRLVGPETIVIIGAFAVLFADGVWFRHWELNVRFGWAATLTVVTSGLAIAWILFFPRDGNIYDGMVISDSLIRGVKTALLSLLIFTAVIALETQFTGHVGEFFALMLLSTLGMMFLVSSEQILMIFVSLELTSLSLYILTAFHKSSRESVEAALKYFLFGGTAAACTLFGLSLVYGISGETSLSQIARQVRAFDPLLALAIVLVMVGFGFKIAAVPFHLWAPDTYQAAPIPSAALIASGSKVASFVVLARIMIVGFAGTAGNAGWQTFLGGWTPLLAAMAVMSMVLGNIGALAQRSVRRLLAYSAIAHAGYMLLGVLAGNAQGISSLFYYLVTYGLTTVGAFGVVAILEQQTGSDDLAAFAGLSRRSPLLALSMLVFLLSLAGIPPLAGFFGKFYLFVAAVNSAPQTSNLLWLVVVAVSMSAVSLFYYLVVLKQIFVADPPEGAARISPRPTTCWVLSLLSLSIILLGCAPHWILDSVLRVVPQLAAR